MMRAIFSLLLLPLVPISSAFGPSSVPRPVQGPGSPAATALVSPWGISRSRPTPTSTSFLLTLDRLLRHVDVRAPLFQPSPSHSTVALRQTVAEEDSRPTKPVKIIIAGAPASGKGTQCERIKARYSLVHLSTGDMLRAAVAAQTDVGRKAKEYMDSGRLVPDEVIIGVVKERLKESDCQERGWLLDGFPRTQAQAQALANSGVEADCFLFLNVPDEVLVERVVGRRTDPETGKIYHLTFAPPPDDAAVISRLQHRSDDTEEKVKVRLQQFHANVNAVKDSYADISVSVDGNQAPEAVSEAIFDAIDSALGAVRH